MFRSGDSVSSGRNAPNGHRGKRESSPPTHRNQHVLLAAAEEEFAENNLDATVAHIAAHAGLGKGTFTRTPASCAWGQLRPSFRGQLTLTQTPCPQTRVTSLTESTCSGMSIA
ncbi:hypothetical protein B7R22_16735 [Subtercola boreus]|uniref:HTH tetR-type domain-containing protein n=1 Tax=Subtercola boreus TaxID=120213 RepID=A0A3E0VQU5_9MICO|nr:hypothetical protein B7R22_16735 [Subtercola boreus]